MLFHISIEAEDPRRTAEMIAEIWQGRAFPFPPVGEGSWTAMAGDDRSTMVEVYPRGTELYNAEGDAPVRDVLGSGRGNGPVHAAIATALSIDEVKAVAARYGAPAKVCSRGPFRVIEVWLDGSFMFEVLTAEMQQEYLTAVTIENWERFIAAGAPKLAA